MRSCSGKAIAGALSFPRLQGLEPPDREVILMRHYEEMSNGEVAQALGLSASGATMRYGRALFRLKEILLADVPAGGSGP